MYLCLVVGGVLTKPRWNFPPGHQPDCVLAGTGRAGDRIRAGKVILAGAVLTGARGVIYYGVNKNIWIVRH